MEIFVIAFLTAVGVSNSVQPHVHECPPHMWTAPGCPGDPGQKPDVETVMTDNGDPDDPLDDTFATQDVRQ